MQATVWSRRGESPPEDAVLGDDRPPEGEMRLLLTTKGVAARIEPPM